MAPSTNGHKNHTANAGAAASTTTSDVLRSRRGSSHPASGVVSPIFARAAVVENENDKEKGHKRYDKTDKKRKSTSTMASPSHNFLLGGQQSIMTPMKSTRASHSSKSGSKTTSSRHSKSSKFQARRLQQQRMRQFRIVAVLCGLVGVVLLIVWIAVFVVVHISSSSQRHSQHQRSGGLRNKPDLSFYSDPLLHSAMLRNNHKVTSPAQKQWLQDLHEARHTLHYGGRWEGLAQQLLTLSQSTFKLPQKTRAMDPTQKQQHNHHHHKGANTAAGHNTKQHPPESSEHHKGGSGQQDTAMRIQQQRKLTAKDHDDHPRKDTQETARNNVVAAPPPPLANSQQGFGHRNEQPVPAVAPKKPQTTATANRRINNEEDDKSAETKMDTNIVDTTKRKPETLPRSDNKERENIEEEDERPFPVRAMTGISLSNHHEPVPAEQQNVVTEPSSDRPLRTLLDYKNSNPNKEITSSCPPLKTAAEGADGAATANFETTLVIQTSLDRAWVLQETCRRWSDPIVAVLVLGHLEAHQEYAHLLPQWRIKCPQMKVLTYTYHHAHHSHSNNSNHDADDSAALYPINVLRNLGLDAVRTSHVLVADVDFVPSYDLPQQIRHALELRHAIHQRKQQHQQELLQHDNNDIKGKAQNQHSEFVQPRDALIVPAFERVCDNPEDCASQHKLLQHNSSYLPQTFEDLRHCLLTDKTTGKLLMHNTKKKTAQEERSGSSDSDDDDNDDDSTHAARCSVFQGRDNWEGHHTTNSPRWLAMKWYQTNDTVLANGTGVHDLVQLTCFYSLRYEPYMVIPWCPTTSSSAFLSAEHRTREGAMEDGEKTMHEMVNSTKTMTTVQPLQPLSPYYDERFKGYGKNKIQFLQHLRFLKYAFYVLPQGFLVHNPHPESHAKEAWNGHHHNKNKQARAKSGEAEKKERSGVDVHKEMDQLYLQFLNELARIYEKDKTHSWLTDYPGVVGLCSDAKAFLRNMMNKQSSKRKKKKKARM